MRVLAIMAHPDDAEFLCAGTLALLAERGHAVGIVTCCMGDCGSVELGPQAIAAVRLKEAHHAASVIGAFYETLGYGDLQLVFDNPTRRAVTEAVRRFAPDVIFTHCGEDYMADHVIAGALGRDAAFTAPLPNYATGTDSAAPVLGRVPHVYYCDAIEQTDNFGRSVCPAFCVDITAVIDKKTEMLARHASQRNWLLKHHGIDEYLESMRTWSRACGERIGVAYAEGFRQHLGHAYPKTNILADVLGSLVRPVADRV